MTPVKVSNLAHFLDAITKASREWGVDLVECSSVYLAIGDRDERGQREWIGKLVSVVEGDGRITYLWGPNE